jgi:flagellar hook-basal body complex protein FliE
MVESLSKIGSSSIPTAAGATQSSPGNAAAFQALLERLDNQARELRSQASRVENSSDLSTAVDQAHASLQEALQIGDRLLEAYRDAVTRNQITNQPPTA